MLMLTLTQTLTLTLMAQNASIFDAIKNISIFDTISVSVFVSIFHAIRMLLNGKHFYWGLKKSSKLFTELITTYKTP